MSAVGNSTQLLHLGYSAAKAASFQDPHVASKTAGSAAKQGVSRDSGHGSCCRGNNKRSGAV